MAVGVYFRASAFKHDITREQILHVLTETAVYDEPLPGNIPAWLVLGDDPAGVPLEVIVGEDLTSGLAVCFHAMPLLWRPPHHPYRQLYTVAKEDRDDQ
jgi:hypothetical protein